jgi:hypothetical protein
VWLSCILVTCCAVVTVCRFGSRARGLKNTVAVHVRLNADVLQQQLEKARAEVGGLFLCIFIYYVLYLIILLLLLLLLLCIIYIIY